MKNKHDVLNIIDKGIHLAARETLIAHKKAGRSIVIWRDGKVIKIPANDIQIPKQRDKE